MYNCLLKERGGEKTKRREGEKKKRKEKERYRFSQKDFLLYIALSYNFVPVGHTA